MALNTQGMAYDHPAYLATINFAGQLAAGSGTHLKFAAWANMIAKRAIVKPSIVSTTADTCILYAVTNTTTRPLGTITITSAQSAYGEITLTEGSNTLALGDELRFTKGTDATVVYAIGIECQLVPGATIVV